MKSAPFKTLLFPYRFQMKDGLPTNIEFAVVKKRSENHWQALAGQGYQKEAPLDSAKRSANEALGISQSLVFFELDSKAMIPLEYALEDQWGDDVMVIPETCYAVKLDDDFEFKLNDQYEGIKWVSYKDAIEIVKWDSNKTALWELKYRILSKKIRM